MKTSTLASATILALSSVGAAADSFQYYLFDPKTSGGVEGGFEVHYRYHNHDYLGAQIIAKFDFQHANWAALAANDGNCTGNAITEFKWHIHTKWDNKVVSGFLGDCSLAKAGNHYDPLFACGPNSEHVTEDKCKPITPKYNCTPATYNANPKACEKGDLSGKVGSITSKNGLTYTQWFDPHYPDPSESTPQWNLMLHAVCGKATPRFICAIAS
ncbi:Aste57867_11154 [Aphanomyces stellatus]|uniref:Aste57867_11154 protein n=1 Tax=Aphanomyces stellatus TaxID=120398 RepID=A0A485KDL0_9STRA|nr:hypothetical protein As57867_011112 [Aphanomyces stellatus]KAF0708764.1 hypothetical protein As57867_006206 [Aphanomyces stellatus]KAF0708765.1 hypothetical protein As57867_006207 [Aphanomyces stellatus]KAF0716506.1 hypothetical protein As57867_002808 [Aphanomyces stellatus]VFT80003.1 Aste57867_2815 [Aphanomyces stellatus]